MRSVTLICGPPCSGKSTYVRKHAQPDDLIVCLDTLARAAGSPDTQKHAPRFYDVARDRYEQLVDQIGSSAGDVRAWIIRCAPLPAERHQLAERAGATETIVLLPSLEEALRRARLERDPSIKGPIHHWYRRYKPARETLIRQ